MFVALSFVFVALSVVMLFVLFVSYLYSLIFRFVHSYAHQFLHMVMMWGGVMTGMLNTCLALVHLRG